MARRTKALLLAGGLGTRLRPITDTVPKCLVPVAGRPMLDYWFDALAAAGIGEVMINTHHLRDAVAEHLDAARARYPFAIRESYEPELLGSAGTVAANRGFMDDAGDCVIIYADNLSDLAIGDLLAAHRAGAAPLTMLVFHAPVPSQCGIATLDADNVVTAFVEKPEVPESDLANGGIYVVGAETWREIADMGAFDFGFDVLPRFVGRMRAWPFAGYLRDIGTHEALALAEAEAPAVFGRRP